MKLSARNTAWMLPLVLSGCFHRTNQSKNQPVAPALPPPGSIKTEAVDLPPTDTTIPAQPTETANTPSQPPPKPRPKRKTQPKSNPADTDVAANVPATPTAVSAIGQISSGNPVDYRRDTEDTIVSVEKGLNSLNRQLDDPEQKTADHIREFIKQARVALGTGDVDGAHNLAAKAKVLLAELQK